MISKERFLTIKRMKSDGVAVAAIARKVGVSEPAVRKWARMDEAGFDALKRNDSPYMDQYREGDCMKKAISGGLWFVGGALGFVRCA